MARERKTIDEYDIQGDYGGGYETLHCEPTHWAARQAIKEYRENEPGTLFRIKKQRVHKHNLTRQHIEIHYQAVVDANKRMLAEHQRKRELRAAKATI